MDSKDTFTKNFNYLYELRKFQVKNKADFARELGLGATTVKQMLNGKANPRFDTIDTLSKSTAISISILFADHEDFKTHIIGMTQVTTEK